MLKAMMLGLALATSAALPAMAQTAKAPIVRGVTTGDLSQQVDETRAQTAELMLRLNEATSEINRLNGRIEALEFELRRTRVEKDALMTDNETLAREFMALRQQADAQSRAIAAIQMNLGMDPEPALSSLAQPGSAAGSQVSSVTPGGGGPRVISGAGNSGSLGSLPASALPGEAGPLFATARQKLLDLDYAGAEQAFRAFIDTFGSDPQAAEAYFWLGEALHQQQAYAESGTAYTTLIRTFPNDPRAADALVRLGRAMRLVGDNDKACVALDALPKRYPNASKAVRDLAAVERTRAGCRN